MKIRGCASRARAKEMSCFCPVERRLPPSPHIRIVSIFQGTDEGVGIDQAGGFLDLGHQSLQGDRSECFFAHRSAEEMRTLEDDTQIGVIPSKTAFAVIDPVDKDASPRSVRKSGRRGSQWCSCPPPARTDQGDGLAGTHGEVEVLQDWLAGLVREVYVAKLQRFDVCRVTVWGEVRGTVGAVV